MSILIKGVSTYFDLILICECRLEVSDSTSSRQRFSNKAVAEGAISYKLDHSVTDRIARYTYGAPCCPQYDSDDPEHIARKHTRFTLPSVRLVVPGYFQAILENVYFDLLS